MRFKEFCPECQDSIVVLADCPADCPIESACKSCMMQHNEIITEENCYNITDYICTECLEKLLVEKENIHEI